jgi:uncharacterized protein (TIGR02646 family)
MGIESIDHFRPKTREEFYELVGMWSNLFLTCTACNQAKREQWDDLLLKPDADGYAFERSFVYQTDTGELAPSPTASPEDQARARTTIEVFKPNRSGSCTLRSATVGLSYGGTDGADLPYHYLLSLFAR